MHDDPEEIQRRLQGNQPAPAALLIAALDGEHDDPVTMAGRLLAVLHEHYELVPR